MSVSIILNNILLLSNPTLAAQVVQYEKEVCCVTLLVPLDSVVITGNEYLNYVYCDDDSIFVYSLVDIP